MCGGINIHQNHLSVRSHTGEEMSARGFLDFRLHMHVKLNYATSRFCMIMCAQNSRRLPRLNNKSISRSGLCQSLYSCGFLNRALCVATLIWYAQQEAVRPPPVRPTDWVTESAAAGSIIDGPVLKNQCLGCNWHVCLGAKKSAAERVVLNLE